MLLFKIDETNVHDEQSVSRQRPGRWWEYRHHLSLCVHCCSQLWNHTRDSLESLCSVLHPPPHHHPPNSHSAHGGLNPCQGWLGQVWAGCHPGTYPEGDRSLELRVHRSCKYAHLKSAHQKHEGKRKFHGSRRSIPGSFRPVTLADSPWSVPPHLRTLVEERHVQSVAGHV